jgi:hypothetical protein
MGLAEHDGGLPFAALDQLYTQILSDVPTRPQLLPILAVVVANFDLSPMFIEHLLELKPGDVRLALQGLHSVILLPEEEDEDPVSLHHASFHDYLNDLTRSGMYYVGGSQQRIDLALLALKAFSYRYNDPDRNRLNPVPT